MQIGISHAAIDAHVALSFGRFFGENVAFEGLLESDFT